MWSPLLATIASIILMSILYSVGYLYNKSEDNYIAKWNRRVNLCAGACVAVVFLSLSAPSWCTLLAIIASIILMSILQKQEYFWKGDERNYIVEYNRRVTFCTAACVAVVCLALSWERDQLCHLVGHPPHDPFPTICATFLTIWAATLIFLQSNAGMFLGTFFFLAVAATAWLRGFFIDNNRDVEKVLTGLFWAVMASVCINILANHDATEKIAAKTTDHVVTTLIESGYVAWSDPGLHPDRNFPKTMCPGLPSDDHPAGPLLPEHEKQLHQGTEWLPNLFTKLHDNDLSIISRSGLKKMDNEALYTNRLINHQVGLLQVRMRKLNHHRQITLQGRVENMLWHLASSAIATRNYTTGGKASSKSRILCNGFTAMANDQSAYFLNPVFSDLNEIGQAIEVSFNTVATGDHYLKSAGQAKFCKDKQKVYAEGFCNMDAPDPNPEEIDILNDILFDVRKKVAEHKKREEERAGYLQAGIFAMKFIRNHADRYCELADDEEKPDWNPSEFGDGWEMHERVKDVFRDTLLRAEDIVMELGNSARHPDKLKSR